MSPLTTRLLRWQGWQLVGDALATLIAWYGASWIRFSLPFPGLPRFHPSRLEQIHELAAVVLLSQLLVLYFLGFFERPPRLYRHQPVSRLVAAVGIHALLLTGYAFFFAFTFPRSVMILFVLLNFLLLLSWRRAASHFYRPAKQRAVMVGDFDEAVELVQAVRKYHWHGLEIVGYLDEAGSERVDQAHHPEVGPRVGSVQDIERLIKEDRFDLVIVVPFREDWRTRLIDQMAVTHNRTSEVLLLPGPFESLIGRMRYRWIEDIPLVEVMQSTEWSFRPPVKRAMDLILGGLLLIPLVPVLAAVAIAVKLDSRGPALYRQQRVGRGRRLFTVYKFRTMEDERPTDNEVLAVHQDPRLTSIGGFLRRTRLNELPQLFNVLFGSMSLVGPRPELPVLAEQNLREVPGYAERFAMTPGITGLSQVNGGYYSSAPNKLRYDLAYLANWSIWLDLSILVRTLNIVLTSKGV